MTIRFSTSVSMMFREHAVAERLVAARDAGFDGAEIQMLAEAPIEAWAAAREAAGIEVALVNVDMGDFLGNGPGLSGVPGREAAFRTAADQTLAAAHALGCRHVHVGPSRVPEGVTREACLATLMANLQQLLPRAEGLGVRLLVEPLNRIETPTVLLADVDEAAEMIRSRLGDRVGLQFDVYHIAMAGIDPTDALSRVRPQVAHVQFSDAPGRKPPGGGSVDFERFLRALKASGYAGWCGAEYFAPMGTAATLGWLSAFRAFTA